MDFCYKASRKPKGDFFVQTLYILYPHPTSVLLDPHWIDTLMLAAMLFW